MAASPFPLNAFKHMTSLFIRHDIRNIVLRIGNPHEVSNIVAT